ncbi:hypothetical protein GCM10010520_54040 [Rhizobium viscosum]|uniref:Uncharacterized protein n=1 Tax=Rhizobium viscosum TaxID=1673 RepID=A0ABR9J004_RHIVS|nr:hypothetical protein [Rhizobium viscosum]MBE1508797.1 hypothetical protein [Rhizobium viscosum]
MPIAFVFGATRELGLSAQKRQVCHDGPARVKTAWYPQFSARALAGAVRKSAPPRASQLAAEAGFDPHRPVMTASVIFHVNMEMTTMTNNDYFKIACTIEELRAEAKAAPSIAERREIEAELEALRAELVEYANEQELP